ncbi:MAG: hypothetical protein GX651_05485 [Methanomicrobiales archaeon]|nr:hypothetical protein [Methanomicrobiales archaeon]
MESLESRIARLTLAQQQEISDFVDFLLQKNSLHIKETSGAQPGVRVSVPPVMETDTHPEVSRDIMSPESGFSSSRIFSAPVRGDRGEQDDGLTRGYLNYADFESEPSGSAERQGDARRPTIARDPKKDSSHLLDWVD